VPVYSSASPATELFDQSLTAHAWPRLSYRFAPMALRDAARRPRFEESVNPVYILPHFFRVCTPMNVIIFVSLRCLWLFV